MQSGIYCLTNTVNQRVYVGSAVSLKARLQQHKAMLSRNAHDNARLQRSWNKHGEHMFAFSVLELVPDRMNLIEREQYWIDRLCAAVKPNLNICPSAGSTLGTKASQSARQKMSLARIGRKQPPEAIAKTAAAHRGMTRSAETRARISAAKTGSNMHPNTRAALRAANVGRRETPETRAKMSLAHQGRKFSPEHCANLSRAMLGNKNTLGLKHSLEARAKMSAAHRARI